MRSGWLLFLTLLFAQPALTQQPMGGGVKPFPSANDAWALALADARTLSPFDRPFIRYVWITSGDVEDGKALSYTLNTISRASVIVRPFPLGKEKLLVMRIDLRNYYPRELDIQQALELFEQFEFDPRFSLLITRGTIAAALAADPQATVKGKPAKGKLKGSSSGVSGNKSFQTGKIVPPKLPDPPKATDPANGDKSSGYTFRDGYWWKDGWAFSRAADGEYWLFSPVGKSPPKIAAKPSPTPPLPQDWPPVKPGNTKSQDSVKTGKRGKYDALKLKDVKVDDIDLIRAFAPALNPAVVDELTGLLETAAPIISDGYFTHRALATIQDAGIYQVIYGGLYYQLAGLPQGSKVGTDEDNLLEQLGVGNVAAGINAAKVFDTLRSDQRLALFRSDVTASPRRIDVFRTLAGRDGSGLFSITHDLKNDDIDIDTHAIANLLDFKDFAREAIWEKPNGLHAFAAIAAANGALVDEVPFNVAVDRTILPPHSVRLQSAISCIACHSGRGSDGWLPAKNDVKAFINARGKLDIFGDISKGELNKPIADTLDRLAGLYSGDPERVFQRGRDDHAAAVLRATGPMKKANAGQTDIVKVAAQAVVQVARSYWYDLVTPQQACKELGVEVDAKDAVRVLNILLAPDTRAAAEVPDVGAIIVPEDPRIAGLRAGLSIVRSDWDLAFGFASERALQNLARLSKEKGK